MIDNKHPDILNTKYVLNKPVRSIPTIKILKTPTYKASFSPYSIKTNKVIMLAKPNLKPGIMPLNKGINDSTIFKTTDKEIKMDNLVNFLILLHLDIYIIKR